MVVARMAFIPLTPFNDTAFHDICLPAFRATNIFHGIEISRPIPNEHKYTILATKNICR
jgi:hypothetical protein